MQPDSLGCKKDGFISPHIFRALVRLNKFVSRFALSPATYCTELFPCGATQLRCAKHTGLLRKCKTSTPPEYVAFHSVLGRHIVLQSKAIKSAGMGIYIVWKPV